MYNRALRYGIPATLAGFALLFAACGGGGDDAESSATDSATTEPTATATTSTDSNGGSDEELFDGKTAAEFFSINCSPCHGQNREGIVGPALVPERLTENDDFYIDTILNGRQGTVMPPWGQQGVSPAEAAALVAFLRTEP